MGYSIADGRLYLEGSPVSLFSGSFQYWRVDPSLWHGMLGLLAEMGLGVVETYVPWSVHETSPGEYDFGDSDPWKDVRRFLELCREAGLKVIMRPGPHINAELTYFGFPERILADEDICCRSADGTPVLVPAPPRMFPAPCYHHPVFLSEVEGYMNALSGAVGDMVHPRGPVIAIQVDNECSGFFRTHPYDQDYSRYSIRLYHRFLQEEYGDISELNRAYRGSFRSWELVDPPRRFDPGALEELPRHLDWVRFGEYSINRALGNVLGVMKSCFGGDVPYFHNYPTLDPEPPFDITGAEQMLDFQGVDFYPRKGHYHTIRRGLKRVTASSRLPYLAEFASGGPFYSYPQDPVDRTFNTWTAVMHGIKGINFFMMVERERWYGAPVSRTGAVRREGCDFYSGFLAEIRGLQLEDMRCRRPVLLLFDRDYERLTAAARLLKPLPRLVGELLHDIDRPGGLLLPEGGSTAERTARDFAELRSFWYWALTAAGSHFETGDGDCTREFISSHSLVIAPTFDFMDRGLQEKLVEYARSGGTVVAGPGVPRLDRGMNPCELMSGYMSEPSATSPEAFTCGVRVREALLFESSDDGGLSCLNTCEAGSGKIVQFGLLPGPIHDVSLAEPFVPLVVTLQMTAGIDPLLVPSDHRIDVSLLEGGGRTILMVANPTEETVETELRHTAGMRFLDTETGVETGGGPIPLELEPYSIRIMEGR